MMFERIVVATGDATDARLQQAAAMLQGARGEIHPFHVTGPKPGDTLDGLLDHVASRHADLLAVGARSHLLARRAAMLAPCSVLMVPDGARLTLDRLLVPVDFSETSAAAVREAARIASHAEGDVTVIAVESDEDPWLDWKDHPERYQKTLEKFVEEAVGKGHGFRCLVEPEHGLAPTQQLGRGGLDNMEGARAATSIVEAAGRLGSTLIVAGTRGRSQVAAVFLGSVVEKIMQHSPIPVLAVKRPGDQLGLLEGLLRRLHGHRQLVAS